VLVTRLPHAQIQLAHILVLLVHMDILALVKLAVLKLITALAVLVHLLLNVLILWDLTTVRHVVPDTQELDILRALQFALQTAPTLEFALLLMFVTVQEQDIMEVFVNMISTSV